VAKSDKPEPQDKVPVAVALRYDAARDAAPRVVAKGKGAEAEEILRLAFANDIKVREDADLAALLEAVELDQLIPLAAFTAVAEILSYLYRLNGGIPDAVRQAAAREKAAG
jgi:flagellar biosynthesis protein